tara:strand:- start:60 stop:557 length:498 start_codon:yes stop_codon:yes gene_type:complete
MVKISLLLFIYMSDECQELKNIKYQTMLLTGSDKIKEPNPNSKSDYINNFLEKETNNNKKESWNKLNKTTKIKLLYDYAERSSDQYSLSNIDIKTLKIYLKSCLDRKQLQHVKDIIYDKESQKIVSIPNLQFKDKKFSLKRSERRVSTLKSLAPQRKLKKKNKRT